MSEPSEPIEEPRPEAGPAVEVLYSNVATVHGGPFDAIIDFGLRQPGTGAAGAVDDSERVVRVAVSWGQLKAMVPLFARVVATYEAQHGPIAAPGFEEESRA